MRKSNGYAKTNDDETSKQLGENKEDYSTERSDFTCGKKSDVCQYFLQTVRGETSISTGYSSDDPNAKK
jgi:hypothetical protein